MAILDRDSERALLVRRRAGGARRHRHAAGSRAGRPGQQSGPDPGRGRHSPGHHRYRRRASQPGSPQDGRSRCRPGPGWSPELTLAMSSACCGAAILSALTARPCSTASSRETHKPALPSDLRGTRIVEVPVESGGVLEDRSIAQLQLPPESLVVDCPTRRRDNHSAWRHAVCGHTTASRSWSTRTRSPVCMSIWPRSRSGASLRSLNVFVSPGHAVMRRARDSAASQSLGRLTRSIDLPVLVENQATAPAGVR